MKVCGSFSDLKLRFCSQTSEFQFWHGLPYDLLSAVDFSF